MNCTEPGHIENSIRQVLSSGPHRFSFQTSVSYRCNPGYYLLGTSSISCQGDGTWDRSLPKCLCEYLWVLVGTGDFLFFFLHRYIVVFFCDPIEQWCSATAPACPPTPRSQVTVGRWAQSSATAASASAPSSATQPACASWTASGAAHRHIVPVRKTQLDCVWAKRDDPEIPLLLASSFFLKKKKMAKMSTTHLLCEYINI